MKKLKYLLIALLLMIPITSKAAVYHCSAPGQVVSGQNFTVRFYGSLSSNSATWSGTVFSEGNARYVSGGTSIWYDGANFSKSVTYTATNPGTARFYVGNIDVSDENQEYSGSDSCTVTIVAASSSNTSSSRVQGNVSQNKKSNDPKKSSDNALKKLEVEGVTLDPEFGADTLEYTATVEGAKDKINIITETNDSKANVDGDGEVELVEGFNEIIVTVYAENGDAREYKLKITREELNPIEVMVNGKKYRVVKKEVEDNIPEGFEKETITINEQEVVAYSNGKITLVLLVDEEGNTSFFKYDAKKSSYSEYAVFNSEVIKIILSDPKKEDIPYGYKRITFTIDGKKVTGYYYKAKDKFRLVYGINESDGKGGFYLYDMDQKTFQRFYDTQTKEYLVYLRYGMYIAAGVALLILILFISIISLVRKNHKLKKNIKPEIKEEVKKTEVKKEEPRPLTRAERLKLKEEAKAKEVKEEKKEDKQETEVFKEEDIKPVKEDTREAKRLQKEEEKKRKEEANNFLK